MKTILAVVGITVFTAPAIAGNAKKNVVSTKPVAVAQAAPIAEIAPAEIVDIPVLPPDPSSALQPLPELEHRPITVTVKPAKPAKPTKAKAPVVNLGASYVLGGRRAAKPEREVEQIIPKSLSQAQVATVVQAHMSDIQNCWELLPKVQRTEAATAMLRLSIADDGRVTDIELGGDVPAGAHKCMTSAVGRWTFPVAETRSDVEYGIALRSL
jgi:hypothetical protein